MIQVRLDMVGNRDKDAHCCVSDVHCMAIAPPLTEYTEKKYMLKYTLRKNVC